MLNLFQRLPFEPDGLTNNNGLGLTVDVLEEIFVNRRFPSKAPLLPISLAESGKSRSSRGPSRRPKDLHTSSTQGGSLGVCNPRGCVLGY